MIDLDKLESRCKKASRNGDGNHPVIASAESIVELIARLRQAEKDAARYRWLRESTHFDSMQHKLYCLHYGERLDRAIDEAIQCK